MLLHTIKYYYTFFSIAYLLKNSFSWKTIFPYFTAFHCFLAACVEKRKFVFIPTLLTFPHRLWLYLWMSDILLSPTTIVLPDGNSIEVSVHSTSRFFRNETQHIFQGIDLSELIAIPTMQRARYDLVNVGDEIEAEKDRLLETVRSLSLFPPYICSLFYYLN